MSRDVARLIWKLSKEDKNLDGLELQAMYKKKIKIDADMQREKLKNLVSNFIKNNYQPVKSKTILSSDVIVGGTATSTKHQIHPNRGDQMSPEKRAGLDENIYAYKSSSFDYVEVTNRESQNLIKYAIVPLSLNWKLENPYNWNSNIEISWDHWPEN